MSFIYQDPGKGNIIADSVITTAPIIVVVVVVVVENLYLFRVSHFSGLPGDPDTYIVQNLIVFTDQCIQYLQK